MALFGHVELGAGERADGAVAGGVGEESAGEAGLGAGGGVAGGDGDDLSVLGLGGEDLSIEEERDVGLGADDGFLLGVAELVGGAGGGFGVVGELLDDLAKPGVFAEGGVALGPDAELGTAVAAEDGAVLD